MIPTFAAREAAYAKMLDEVHVTKAEEVNVRAAEVLKLIDEYKDVSEKTGVPIVVLMAINERESGSNFHSYLGNGDPLGRETRDVPRGRGPFQTWKAGAIDALHFDGLDAYAGKWTLELACYACERYNGWGYLARGIPSPYLWACTNIYKSGKYVADGKFSESAVDEQIGCVALMGALISLEPDLALPRSEVPGTIGGEEAMHPLATPDQVSLLQVLLNRARADGPLVVDGNYGRKTRAQVAIFQESIQPASAGPPVPGSGEPNEQEMKALIRSAAAAPGWDSQAESNVILIQAALNEFGAHPKLVTDGVLGQRTVAEICAFQDTNNLEQTGKIDADTVAAIRDKIERNV